MSAILFVESNTTGTGRVFLTRAGAAGLEVHFAFADRARYGFLAEAEASGVVLHHIDTRNIDALFALTAQISGLRAIYSTSELYVEIAARLAGRLGLFSPDADAVAACRDKLALARTLAEAGIRVPATRSGDAPDAQSLPAPWVLKPRRGTGSAGVERIDDSAALAEALRARAAAGDDCLVQSYYSGQEYSVELVGDGRDVHVLAVVRKHLGKPPYFVEIGHDCPAPLPAADRARIADVAVRAARAMGLDKGPAHVELRAGVDGDIAIIEINPRLAGGMIPLALEHSGAFDLIGALIALYLGNATLGGGEATFVECEGAVSIRFLLSTRAGTLVSVDGLDRAAASAGVLEAGLMNPIGTRIALAGDFRDRIAYVIAAGTDAFASAAAAESALSAIACVVD